jgi:hypothetical protein
MNGGQAIVRKWFFSLPLLLQSGESQSNVTGGKENYGKPALRIV